MRKLMIQPHQELVAELGGGYEWSELYYDSESRVFFEDRFHTGSVDDAADYYDGRRELAPDEVIELLERQGKEKELALLRHRGLV